MTELYDDYMREKYAEGVAKGNAKGKDEFFEVLTKVNGGSMTIEEAAAILHYPAERIAQLAKQ